MTQSAVPTREQCKAAVGFLGMSYAKCVSAIQATHDIHRRDLADAFPKAASALGLAVQPIPFQEADDAPQQPQSDLWRRPTFKPHIEWHSSETDGPPDVGQMLYIEDEESGLWVGEISKLEFEEQGGDELGLGDDGGWWMVRHRKGKPPQIIGKVSSETEPAIELLEFIRASADRIEAAQPSQGDLRDVQYDEAAKIIYNLFPYAEPGEKPIWIPRGNSLKQDEARKLIRDILAASPKQPTAQPSREAALADLLRVHFCNPRPTLTVGECVREGLCACSCGLLLKDDTPAKDERRT